MVTEKQIPQSLPELHVIRLDHRHKHDLPLLAYHLVPQQSMRFSDNILNWYEFERSGQEKCLLEFLKLLRTHTHGK